MQVLSIDIGGTKSALALCDIVDSKVISVEGLTTFKSREFKSLEGMVDCWQQQHSTLRWDALGAGAAGPVVDGKVHLTNLGWTIDTKKITNIYNKPVYLCNDMESHSWGIIGISERDLQIINAGKPRKGSKALIAAGTGLGESIIPWTGQIHVPMGGEGGHATFSPSSDDEFQYHDFLRQKIGSHVSWERVLGGFDGFQNMILFWREHRSRGRLPAWMINIPETPMDCGAALIDAAHAGDHTACEILDFYALLYGKEAGNLALKCLPHAGLYIGGGIAPRILPWIKKHFIKGFTAKGRFETMMGEFPVYVVTDSLNGLKGAAIQCERKNT
jgi:glucokinase